MSFPRAAAVVREWSARLRGTFSRSRDDRDLEEELRLHIELATEAARRRVESPNSTGRDGAARTAGTAQAMEALRDQRGLPLLDDLVRDVRHGARLLRRSPGFTIVAVLTLALCIGANSALFSVIDAVLLRPLPLAHAGEIYVVRSTYDGARREFASLPDFADWRARNRVFAWMAATRGASASITTPGGAERLTGAAVSEDFFALFDVRPLLGRTFLAGEHQPQQAHVVILSHSLWLRRFGGNPGVIGTSVVFDSEPNTVVGVMPPGFAFPEEAELWRPLTLTVIQSESARRADVVQVLARLRPDRSAAQAQVEMTAIARELELRHPTTNAKWGVELVSLQAKSTEDVRRTLLALWGAVACVLLIGCANVGILLLSRGLRRAQELAVRTALGAGRGRMVRQLLTESVLLGLMGGGGGLLVAAWGIFALRAVPPVQSARFQAVGLDLQVVIFTAALSLATGLLVGVVPVWRIMRSEPDSALREGGRAASGGLRQRRVMRVLAIGQVAVSLVLLTGAGLMIRTLERLQAVPLGFSPDHLLTFYVSLPEARYSKEAQARAFFQELLARVRALPGVASASAVNALYIHWSRAYVMPLRIEGRPAADRSLPADTHVRIVDPEIHRVLQIPILRGRSFSAEDGPGAPPRVVVNEAMARRYFTDENPIGQRISVRGSPRTGPVWEEIIGVAGNVRQQGLDAGVFPEIQESFTQSPLNTMAILVRSAAAPGALAPSIRAEVQALDPNLPLTFMQTMEEVIGQSLAERRFGMRLLAMFGGIALLLTAVGLYGVMAAAVGERTREIAVRLALGAAPSRIVWTVVRQLLGITLAGVSAGVVAALGATRLLDPLLFGISRTDPATYGTTAAILVIVALVSSYVPARNVAHVDPATTLRSE